MNLESNVRVIVQAKDFWLIKHGKLVNIFSEFTQLVISWSIVSA